MINSNISDYYVILLSSNSKHFSMSHMFQFLSLPPIYPFPPIALLILSFAFAKPSRTFYIDHLQSLNITQFRTYNISHTFGSISCILTHSGVRPPYHHLNYIIQIPPK